MHSREIWSATLLCVLILSSGKVIAGGNSGQIGIGLSVTESSPSFAITIWGSNHITIEPSIAISSINHSYIRFLPGLKLGYHMRAETDMRPYFGLGAVLDILRANDSTYRDIGFGPFFGMEYFFNKHLSIAGEYEVGFIITDNKFSPSFLPKDAFGIATAGYLTARFYF